MKVSLYFLSVVCFFLQSCFDNSKPNYQYFPNMYEPVGYETYAESTAFPDGVEALLPPENTIARGWQPYIFEDTNEGYEAAKLSTYYSLEETENALTVGKKLYNIYCSTCHGANGNGQGVLVKREKYLGVPSYADREISPGSIYHVLMYGKNAMGSHAGQVNDLERRQIALYVMSLRDDLTKEKK